MEMVFSIAKERSVSTSWDVKRARSILTLMRSIRSCNDVYQYLNEYASAGFMIYRRLPCLWWEIFVFIWMRFLRLILINNHNIKKKIFSFRNPVERIATPNLKTPTILQICPLQPVPTPHNPLPALPFPSHTPHKTQNPNTLKTTSSEYKNHWRASHGILLHIAIGGPKFLHKSKMYLQKIGRELNGHMRQLISSFLSINNHLLQLTKIIPRTLLFLFWCRHCA